MNRTGCQIVKPRLWAFILVLVAAATVSADDAKKSTANVTRFAPSGEINAVVDAIFLRLASRSAEHRRSALVDLQTLAMQDAGPTAYAVLRLLSDTPRGVASEEVRAAWRVAETAWLHVDPAAAVVPLPTDTRIDEVIDVLLQPQWKGAAPNETDSFVAARWFDVWASDGYAASVLRERIERRRKDARLYSSQSQALDKLLRDASPTLCAEIWRTRPTTGFFGHGTSQFLTIGVPQQPEGGMRRTFFSDGDAHSAYLVEGNTLAPGSYPVGAPFAYDPRLNPNVPPLALSYDVRVVFYLNYLPTSRERLLYEAEIRSQTQQARWEQIASLGAKRLLESTYEIEAADVWMIERFPPSIAGPLAIEVLASKPDRALTAPTPILRGGPGGLGRPGMQIEIVHQPQGTLHERMIGVLRMLGSAADAQDLIQAMRSGDWRTEGAAAEYAWQAVLACAARHPGQESDEVLTEVLEWRVESPTDGYGPSDPTAAIAAALLLRRHYVAPRSMGVITGLVDEPADAGFRPPSPFNSRRPTIQIPAAEFTADGSPERVLQWLQRRRAHFSKNAAKPVAPKKLAAELR